MKIVYAVGDNINRILTLALGSSTELVAFEKTSQLCGKVLLSF